MRRWRGRFGWLGFLRGRFPAEHLFLHSGLLLGLLLGECRHQLLLRDQCAGIAGIVRLGCGERRVAVAKRFRGLIRFRGVGDVPACSIGVVPDFTIPFSIIQERLPLLGLHSIRVGIVNLRRDVVVRLESELAGVVLRVCPCAGCPVRLHHVGVAARTFPCADTARCRTEADFSAPHANRHTFAFQRLVVHLAEPVVAELVCERFVTVAERGLHHFHSAHSGPVRCAGCAHAESGPDPLVELQRRSHRSNDAAAEQSRGSCANGVQHRQLHGFQREVFQIPFLHRVEGRAVL